jgi:hypothetical protein
MVMEITMLGFVSLLLTTFQTTLAELCGESCAALCCGVLCCAVLCCAALCVSPDGGSGLGGRTPPWPPQLRHT